MAIPPLVRFTFGRANTAMHAFSLLSLALAGGSVALPNLVVVVVDDWGHNNVGYHNHAGEIQTPHIDALAAAGVILDRHYAFQFCSPSRSALHTGRNPIHVNVLNSDLAAVNLADPVSGFAGMPRNMTAFPSKLLAAGYNTVQAGKWVS